MPRKYEEEGGHFVPSPESGIAIGSPAALANLKKASSAMREAHISVFFTCFRNALAVYRQNNELPEELTKRPTNPMVHTFELLALTLRGVKIPFVRNFRGKPYYVGGSLAARLVPLLGPQAAIVLQMVAYLVVHIMSGGPRFVVWKVIWNVMQAWILSTVCPTLGAFICMYLGFDGQAQETLDDWLVLENIVKAGDSKVLGGVFAISLGNLDEDARTKGYLVEDDVMVITDSFQRKAVAGVT